MRNWIIGLIAGCSLLGFSAPSFATGLGLGGVDAECFKDCIRTETADRCPVGAVAVCTGRCTVVQEEVSYYNGIQLHGAIVRNAQGIEYYQSATEAACNACIDDNTNSDGFSNGFTCAVQPASSTNLCTQLDPNNVTTNTVGPISNEVFAESIRLGRVLWNLSLINPCDPIGGGETVIYNGAVNCSQGIQVGGMGCREKKKGDTTVSGLCYFDTTSANPCNMTTQPKCFETSVDTCSDGNLLGRY